MPFLDKNGLEYLTKKIVQAENIKVISPRGHTVKNVIDNINRECSDIKTPHTMTLVNETGQFKVGEGQGGVDVSGDVEQGKFDFQLEGKTFKNCVDSTFAGCRTNASKKANIVRLDGNSKYSQVNFNLPVDTEYTFFIKVLNNKLASGTRTDVNKAYCISTTNNETEVIRSISNGVTGMLPPFSLIGKDGGRWGERNVWFEISDAKGGHVDLEIYIFEGKLKEFPLGITDYFEGLSSTGEKEKNLIEIKSCGKNLLNQSDKLSSGILNDRGQEVPDETSSYYKSFISVKPSTTYSYSGDGTQRIYYFDINKRFISRTTQFFSSPGTFKTPEQCYFIKAQIHKPRLKNNIQLEENPTPTPYEPYQGDTKQIQLPHPLRKVGDVADRIYEKDGRVWLEQNIGEIVLDGSEYIVTETPRLLDCLKFVLIKKGVNKKDTDACKCDTLVVGDDGIKNSIRMALSNKIVINIEKSKLQTQDIQGFKKWLSENPTTVLYQLETPITTELKPFGINIKPHTTIKIENSILPKITYEVQLNRSAQIENSIKSIQSLRQRIDKLEKHYDNHLLENQYKIDLLKLEKGDEL